MRKKYTHLIFGVLNLYHHPYNTSTEDRLAQPEVISVSRIIPHCNFMNFHRRSVATYTVLGSEYAAMKMYQTLLSYRGFDVF